MKTKLHHFTVLFLVFGLFYTARISAQIPSWLWASNAGANSYDEAFSVATDENGNSYVAGYYNVHIYELPQSNGPDAFIAIYDPEGNVTWTTAISDTGSERIYSICLDKLGHYYVLGTFGGKKLHLGDTVFSKADASSNDIFLAKYDTMHNLLWAAHAGGTLDDYPTGMAVDSAGYCYITGWYNSTDLVLGSVVLPNTSVNFAELFVAKYDPDGNVLWAKSAQGASGGADKPYAIAIDKQGDCYITGDYNSNILTFGSIQLKKISNFNMFLAKYSTNGNVLWAKRAVCTGDCHGYALAVEPDMNLYVTGAFKNTITFGATKLTSKGSSDVFLAKYAPDSTVIWAEGFGGAKADAGTALNVDKLGYCYMAGYYVSDSLKIGDWQLTNYDGSFEDIVLSAFTPYGHPEWAKSIGGDHVDKPASIALDASRNIIMAGALGSATMVVGDTTLENFGTRDVLVAKSANTPPSGVQTIDPNEKLLLYPNPAHGKVTVNLKQRSSVTILGMKGNECRRFSDLSGKATIDISGLEPGIYVVGTLSDSEVTQQKLIIY